jgi:hypothetical protein
VAKETPRPLLNSDACNLTPNRDKRRDKNTAFGKVCGISRSGKGKGYATLSLLDTTVHATAGDTDVIDRDSSANRSDVANRPGKPLTRPDPAKPPVVSESAD